MGLDITGYSRLKHVGKHEKDSARNEGEPGGLDDFCYYEGHVQAYAYKGFEQSFRGIPILGEDAQHGFIVGGCYEITAATKTHGFRAGSYGGYGTWRADLQAQFNPARHPDKPFYELIFFADNEGCIGPDAAKDLLEDFRYWSDHYRPPADWHPSYRDVYRDWLRAFELAADGGLVYFH
jgi:hypothetical protein